MPDIAEGRELNCRRQFVERRQANLRSLIYALFRTRRRNQRRTDSGVTYHDYYDPLLLSLSLALMLLCIADAFNTMLLLQYGSVELNPFMAWALGKHVMVFFALKYGITAGCMILTVVHRDFRVFDLRGVHILGGCVALYVCLLVYQLFLLLPILT